MNIDFRPEDEAFRDEVRGFIVENLPPECADSPALGVMTDKSVVKRWHRTLYEKGWAAPAWPEEYGGTGWNATQRFIFNEEIASANAPRLMPFGLNMVGPVIYTFGNEEQKSRHLPGILSGDVWWCQGYSDPGAGSDLASLKTAAVRDGDHYIIMLSTARRYGRRMRMRPIGFSAWCALNRAPGGRKGFPSCLST